MSLRSRRFFVPGFALACMLPACDDGTGVQVPVGQLELRAERVVSGLSSPVHLTSPPGDDRLFIVEQGGRIRVFEDGQLRSSPFLDIASRVRSGGEQGLLSMAFHPDYATNGFFFVYYTDNGGDTRVERYRVSADPNVADAASMKLILAHDQPYANHNGGLVMFGPDGMFYIGLGDGGSGGDPHGHGQNRGTLLGALLRIDVDAGDPYGIPADNPFRDTAGARPEIWAYGLRNPWRFDFDEPTDHVYIADVGQNRWEEINVVDAGAAGVNYGWKVREGAHCYNASTCASDGLTDPILEYDHGDGCSITGGYVYRGSAIPELVGHYFFGDYCDGWVGSFRVDGDRAVERVQWELGSLGNILSFGEDAAGEVYVLSQNGSVYRLVKE
jgi:glucose/arabinose dehydrogenase